MLARPIFLLTATLALAVGCNSGNSNEKAGESANIETIEATTDDGFVERFSRRKSDFARQGLYYKLNPAGQTVEVAQYENDTLHGTRALFYETGDTLLIEHYQKGSFEGNYRAFYPGGKLELEGNYVANTMEGKWNAYYENGQLKEIVTFSDNEENGPFIEYHPNGNLKAEGYYKGGDKEDGLLKLYDETGKLVKTMDCNSGICRTVWKADAK